MADHRTGALRASPAKTIFLLGALASGGCALYRAEPLDPAEEWMRIEGARLTDLVARAREEKSEADTGPPPFDYSDGLSAEEAAGLAVILNPGLRALRAKEGIAEGQLIQAGLFPNPELSVKLLDPTTSTSWSREGKILFDLTQSLLRRGIEKERARIRVDETRWTVAAEEWRVASEVRATFADVIYSEEALRLFAERRSVAERVLAGTRERQAVGESALPETLDAEANLGDLDREGKRLLGQKKKTRERLNRLLGLPPRHETMIQTRPRPLEYTPLSGAPEALAEQLRARRPDLLAARQAYEGAESELRLACWKQFPTLRAGPAIERASGESGAEVGFEVGLELPIFNWNQGDIAAKRALREEKRFLYTAALETARGELYAAWTDLETLDAELSLYFAEVAPRLDKSLELTEKAFQVGQISRMDFLEAQGRLLATRNEVLKSLRDYEKARIALDHAAGPQLPPPEATK